METKSSASLKSSTRARIIAEADELFYEQGFETTSFAHVAARVGVSRGNFYYHFKTKDQILDGVIDLRMTKTKDMLNAWSAEVPDPMGRIAYFIRILNRNQSQIMANGCPVGSLVSELGKLGHDATARASAVFCLFADWLSAQFQTAGLTEPAAFEAAAHLLVRSQGVAILAQAFKDEQLVEREVSMMIDWVASQIATASTST